MKTDMGWHCLDASEALKRLDSSHGGLPPDEARRRLEQYGQNELEERGKPSPLIVFLSQFASPLIYLLLAAAAISLVLAHFVDAGVILFVVILNAIVGFIQEIKAEEAIAALKELAAPKAFVQRGGQRLDIPARDLVPGDIVLLGAGDRVPADARLFESANLRVDESILTGESKPVDKVTGVLPEALSLADKVNMVWMGSRVLYGRGVAIVVATGMNTEMGRIAGSVQSVVKEDTPLQRRMEQLTRTLGYLALVISGVIFAGGLLRGFELFEMFLFALAAAVAAVPEGLPAIVTIVLALGVRRMARRNVVIRRLPSVETLGSADVICTDKTGTLTRNEMTVEKIYVGGKLVNVTGEGYIPRGRFHLDSRIVEPEEDPDLSLLLRIGVLANDAHLRQVDHRYGILGDPTEGALLVAAAKGGMQPNEMEKQWRRLHEIPFQSEIGFMATLDVGPDGKKSIHVKGSPEKILSMCKRVYIEGKALDLMEEECDRLRNMAAELASQALRVLALGYAEVPDDMTEIKPADVEQRLVLVGLVGMIDPPREEAKNAIKAAHEAGIKVNMITGDDKITAAAIGEQLGLPRRGVVTGVELARMSDDELAERIEDVSIFARVEPEQKLRIVRALKRRGHVVAMTGDGVNDAPALKMADIGVAMGITGTDVAREESDMVLTDDNFASIVAAIEEGRVIFENIKRVVFYLLSTNVGEITTLLVSLIIGLPLPLIAIQVLFINLVTDSMYDISLGVEPKHGNVLRKPPRGIGEQIITRGMLYRFAAVALFMTIGTLGLFVWQLEIASLDKARTVAFTAMAVFQWFNAFNARSDTESLFSLGLFTNRWLLLSALVTAGLQAMVVYVPALQQIFRTEPLGVLDWVAIVLVCSSILVAEEIRKALSPDLFK